MFFRHPLGRLVAIVTRRSIVMRFTVRQAHRNAQNNFVFNAGFTPATSTSPYGRQPLLLLDGGRVMTYADVNNRCARLAECMNMIYRIGRGDIVMCRASKRTSVFVYLATLRLGAIYVPLNPTYTPPETAHFVENAQPKLFVTNRWRQDVEFLTGNRCPSVVEERLILEQSSLFAGQQDVEFVNDKDVATIIYTSGTTGKPKGVALSHGALRRNAERLLDVWRFTSQDVLLHTLPFYHIHGMFLSFHCTLLSRSAAIFRDEFNARDCLNLLSEATVFSGVPTHYRRLVDVHKSSSSGGDFGRMRLFINGSAPLAERVASTFRQQFSGYRIHERYGMSEAMVMTAVPLDEDIDRSVGRPLLGVNLRISDGGEVQVQSDCLFNGYWREESMTTAAFTADGFFRTGDVGELDERGNLRLYGRQTDMIISGGLNVYPAEVEAAIDSSSEVTESAVIGVSHDDFGEAVVAVCVVPLPLSNDGGGVTGLTARLRAHVANRLASYKIPKKWIFVDELPRNSMRKVEKKKLRDAYVDVLAVNADC